MACLSRTGKAVLLLRQGLQKRYWLQLQRPGRLPKPFPAKACMEPALPAEHGEALYAILVKVLVPTLNRAVKVPACSLVALT